jgi:hypothetical protein
VLGATAINRSMRLRLSQNESQARRWLVSRPCSLARLVTDVKHLTVWASNYMIDHVMHHAMA